MDKWQLWYRSSDFVRITTRDGVELPWHDLYVWAVRNDNVPSRVEPDKTERINFNMPEGCPALAKGSVVTISFSNWGFACNAVVLFDLPYDSRGIGPRGVQLEWVK